MKDQSTAKKSKKINKLSFKLDDKSNFDTSSKNTNVTTTHCHTARSNKSNNIINQKDNNKTYKFSTHSTTLSFLNFINSKPKSKHNESDGYDEKYFNSINNSKNRKFGNGSEFHGVVSSVNDYEQADSQFQNDYEYKNPLKFQNSVAKNQNENKLLKSIQYQSEDQETFSGQFDNNKDLKAQTMMTFEVNEDEAQLTVSSREQSPVKFRGHRSAKNILYSNTKQNEIEIDLERFRRKTNLLLEMKKKEVIPKKKLPDASKYINAYSFNDSCKSK